MEKRWSQKTPEGILIEDDGGFVNFFPTNPQPCLGSIMGFGMDDEDEVAPMTPPPPQEKVADVIDLLEWKRKKGIK